MVESLQIDSQPTLANPMIPEVVENKKGVELRLPISIPDLAGGSNPTEVLLQFGCYEMGQERTGVHGRIEAFLVFKYGSGRERKDLLSFTRCNIIDDDRRTRFAGKVFKRFSSYGDLPSIYNKNDLTADLDAFCYEAFPAWLGTTRSRVVLGNPDLPLNFTIEPFILENSGTILYARPKRAKSYVSQLMALCVDANLSSFWPVTQGNSLYINLERNNDSLVRRLGHLNKAMGLDPFRGMRMLEGRGKTLYQLMDSINMDIEEFGTNLIVLDSISRSGMGDLNENRTGTRIIDNLNQLIEGRKCSWLAIGHTSWAEEHVFGSIQFEAGADSMVALRSDRNPRDKSELGIWLDIAAANDTANASTDIMAFKFGPNGVKSIRKAKAEEFPSLMEKAIKGEPQHIQIYADLKEYGASTPKEIVERTEIARGSVGRVLNEHPEMFEHAIDTDSGKELPEWVYIPKGNKNESAA